MAKNIMKTPSNFPVNPPAGHKGSPGVYDGKHGGEFGQYSRTPSKDGAPEKHMDTPPQKG